MRFQPFIRLFFCLVIFTSCKEGSNQTTSSNNITLTNKHISIPGSKIYIIPPKGFVWSDVAGGFVKDEDGSTIIWTEELSIMYEDIKSSDIEKITNERSVTISGYPGTITNYSSKMKMICCDIVFGDTSFTEILRGSGFSNRTQSLKDIAIAYETIIYKK